MDGWTKASIILNLMLGGDTEMLCVRVYRHARNRGGGWRIAEKAINAAMLIFETNHCREVYLRMNKLKITHYIGGGKAIMQDVPDLDNCAVCKGKLPIDCEPYVNHDEFGNRKLCCSAHCYTAVDEVKRLVGALR